MRVLVESDEPESLVKDGVVVGGFCKDLLDKIAETLRGAEGASGGRPYRDFSVEYTVDNPDIEWEEVILKGEYHVFCMRRASSHGVENFEITQPVVTGAGFSLVGRAAKTVNYFGWLHPFTHGLWACFFLLMLLPAAGIFLYRVAGLEFDPDKGAKLLSEMSWGDVGGIAAESCCGAMSSMLGQSETVGGKSLERKIRKNWENSAKIGQNLAEI